MSTAFVITPFYPLSADTEMGTMIALGDPQELRKVVLCGQEAKTADVIGAWMSENNVDGRLELRSSTYRFKPNFDELKLQPLLIMTFDDELDAIMFKLSFTEYKSLEVVDRSQYLTVLREWHTRIP